MKRIKYVSILNYIDYNKGKVLEILKSDLAWVYYGGKHYESVYTRFFQGYILSKKFNIDKRRAHYSDLINSGQLNRERALLDLELPAYDDNLFRQDYNFVLKKFELTEEQFDVIMNAPINSFRDYPNNYAMISRLKKMLNFLRKKNIFSR